VSVQEIPPRRLKDDRLRLLVITNNQEYPPLSSAAVRAALRILSWPHSGFNVHSPVRAKPKIEAERVGKYMIRPIFALDRLSFLESEGPVG